MALRPVTIPLLLHGGIDTSVDEKVLPPGKLLGLENGVFDKGGTAKKRFGYTDQGSAVFGTATPLPAGRALGVRDKELLHFSEEKLHTYQDDAAAWVEAGDMQSVVVSHEVVAKSTSEQTLADCDTLSGIAAYAWEDSQGGVYAAVLDDDTGAVIVSPRQLDANGERPRVHAVDDQIHVYYADATNGYIWVLVVSPMAPHLAATDSPSLMIADLDTTTPIYDVDTDATKAAIVWNNDTAGQLGVGYVHSTGVIGSPSTGLTSPVVFTGTADVGLSVALDPGGTSEIGLCWAETGGNVVVAALSSTFSTALAPLTLVPTGATIDRLGCCFMEDDDPAGVGYRRCWIFYEKNDATDQNRTVHRHYFTTNGEDGGSATWRGVALASKPFRDSGTTDQVYVHLAHETTLWATYFLRRTDDLVIGRMLSGTAGGVPARDHLPSVKTSGRVASWAAVYKVALEGANDDVYTEKGIRRVELDFDSAESHQTVQLNRSAYISGGMLWEYDGDNVVEAGFHLAPDDVAAPVQAAPAGDGVDVGTHLYRFVYEWTNAQGRLVQGPTSAGTTVVVASTAKKVTFAVPTLRTSARSDVRIGVWRTEVGGSVYYRVTSLDPNVSGINGYLANSAAVDTVSFDDEMSDATLITKEPLYTNGGILSNDPIEPGAHIASGKNRIFATDAGDPNLVRYSQEIRDAYAAEFSPVLQVRIDPYGGDITGLVVMDDSVIVFKESAIYHFAGPGPLANPDAGGGFSAPQLITSDVGCKTADSICYTPAGVLFQSKKGIYLLDRGRQVSYIGSPVEDFNDQTITSCDLIEDDTQIRILTSSGSTLLWDYDHNAWATFTNHEGLDAVVVDGVYHYLRSSGQVWKESTAFADNGSQIPMVITTPWLHFSRAIQGFQRVWHLLILGEYKSDHQLRLRYQVDFEPGWKGAPLDMEPDDFYAEANYGSDNYGDGVYGGGPTHRYQFRVHIGEKCEAIKFRFEDVEDTGDAGAAYELTELLVLGGRKGPDYKMGDARSQ